MQLVILNPDLSIIKAILFWDTKIDKLDRQKQKKTIIKRVFEHGNDIEKTEMTRFYGSEVISEVLSNRIVS